MRLHSEAKALSKREPPFGPAPVSILQRNCTCGGSPGLDGECEECRSQRLSMQRRAMNGTEPTNVPPIVHEALRSSGQPLDPATRAFMEPPFGHNFSQVRVHTDARAAASAEVVNALAYTIGHDVVFGAGQYAPRTSEGQQLLAHELTHVVQQAMTPRLAQSASESTAEDEAEQNAARITAGTEAPVNLSTGAGTIQRQGKPPAPTPSAASWTPSYTAKDATAISIITGAKNQQRDVKARAVEALGRIIHEYYPGEGSKVRSLAYDDAKAGNGLLTTMRWSPQAQTYFGEIYVGQVFLNEVASGKDFARHVLQVGHELEHIEQHRRGMVGPTSKCEREFLAFMHEGLATEKPATGRMQYNTRIDLIDQAIGYYYCLKPNLQQRYANDEQQLLNTRNGVIAHMTSVRYPAPTKTPPTRCTPEPGDTECKP